MEADNVTFPLNPPDGVTVIVEILPVKAPGDTVTDVAEIVNDGAATATVVVADALKNIFELWASGV